MSFIIIICQHCEKCHMYPNQEIFISRISDFRTLCNVFATFWSRFIMVSQVALIHFLLIPQKIKFQVRLLQILSLLVCFASSLFFVSHKHHNRFCDFILMDDKRFCDFILMDVIYLTCLSYCKRSKHRDIIHSVGFNRSLDYTTR